MGVWGRRPQRVQGRALALLAAPGLFRQSLTPPCALAARYPMLDDAALDTILRTARTHSAWTGTPIGDEKLHALYELTKFGPTSANCSPARFVFLRTQEARERLLPALSAGNVAKTMAAAVTVIVAYDPTFYDRLPY